ncbi:MAG: flagellar biosynthetic protein FliQ [Bryobacteraceae bacterium]|jgi:flagellar biosynthesis protein FliQ
MTPEFVIQIVKQALMMAFWISAPLLVAGFVVGVFISLIQVLTSMQDSAFSTVPRLAAFLLALLIALPWMLRQMISYTAGILSDLGRYAR